MPNQDPQINSAMNRILDSVDRNRDTALPVGVTAIGVGAVGFALGERYPAVAMISGLAIAAGGLLLAASAAARQRR